MEQAIKQGDVKTFSTLITALEYTLPVYLDNKRILHWICIYEATNILNYLEQYIKNHKVNILSKGTIYESHAPHFKSYKFYQLIRSHGDEKEIHSQYTNMIHQLHPCLAFRLMHTKVPERIIKIFHDICSKIVDMYGTKPVYNSKMQWPELVVQSNICGYLMGDVFADFLQRLSFEEKIEFIDNFKRDYFLNFRYTLPYALIAINDIKTIEYLGDTVTISPLGYVQSCKNDDLDVSIKLFNKVTNLQLTRQFEEQLLSKKVQTIIKNSISKDQLIMAYKNSLESKHTGLIQFNKTILNKCHKRLKLESLPVEPNRIDRLTQIKNSKKLEGAIVGELRYILEYIAALDLQQIESLLDFIHKKNIQIKYGIAWQHAHTYATIFFCCLIGLRNKFNNIDFLSNNVIFNYFDELNVELKKIILESQVLYPPLLNLITTYAQY
jgi:hypothetical protein